MSPAAISPSLGTQAYCPCAVQETVTGSTMTDNNGPDKPPGAGPMPAWSGNRAEAAPGPDEQITTGFNPTLKCGAAFEFGAIGFDPHIPPGG